jgi:hypothetical protein
MSENLGGIEDSVIVVRCMYGIGDSTYTTIGFNAIYLALKEQYAASNIHKAPYFYAVTPLPQLFSHLPYVRCIKPTEVDLRTQGKNAARKDLNRYWKPYPVVKEGGMIVKLAVNYFERFGGDDHWSTPGNMLLPIISNAFMAWDLRRFPMEMTLPHFDVELPDWARKPFILLRENVIRKEWPASARNCHPKYLKAAIKILRQQYNYPIVSIADLQPNQEWIENSCPSDYQYHKGEFNLEQMCELVHRATLCLGSQGWISPFSMAAKTNAIIILGGAGYENHPKRLTHEKLDTHTVQFIKPDNMCECKGIRHESCDKTIVNFEEKFIQALSDLVMA